MRMCNSFIYQPHVICSCVMPPSKGCARYVEVWGPCGWKFLHAIAATAPVGASGAVMMPYLVLYTAIGDTLPCPHCREHYKRYLTKVPLQPFLLDQNNHAAQGYTAEHGNIALQRWVHELHNEVSGRLNKKKLGFDESLHNVHNACTTRVTPAALADPYYGSGAPWATMNQSKRVSGEFFLSTPTSSFWGSNIMLSAVLIALLIACLVVSLSHDRKAQREVGGQIVRAANAAPGEVVVKRT